MATSAPGQVPTHSIDANAISVVVSDRNSSDPRPGSFFNNDFSAVSPVHFHPLDGGKFFGVFSQRWHTVTRPSDANNPNLFSDKSVENLPSWAIFDGTNGHHYSIPGQYGINPPTGGSYDSRVFVGGCSRTNSYMYLMQSVTSSGDTFGLVSHFHVNPVTWQVNLLGEEEILPVSVGSESVTFNLGVKHNVSFLTFVGKDSSNRLYLARKNWGQIGRVASFEFQGGVEFQGEKGWSSDPSKLVPLKTSDGILTSSGPVSLAEYRGKTYMSVTNEEDGNVFAQVYVSSGLWDAWVPLNHPYPLGTQSGSYLGGTAYLQQSLRANTSMLSESSVTGIPLVYAKKVISGDNSGISIFWDLWPISAGASVRSFSSEAHLDVMSGSSSE